MSDANPTTTPASSSARSASMGRHALAIACILGIASGVYVNAGHEQFFFDSIRMTYDPLASDMGRAARQFLVSGPMPGQELSMITFAANYSWNTRHGLPGFDAKSFVIVNVALHALTACMLYLVICALFSWTAALGWGGWCAFFAALLFAVHPLHVTSVVYVVQRRGILCTLFYLMSIWAFIHAGETASRERRVWTCLTILSVFLCIKSKTMGLTLPIALWALYGIRSFQRRGALPRFFISQSISAIVLLGLVAGATLSGKFRALPTMATSLSPWSQFLTQLRVIASTYGLIVLPLNRSLSIDHPFSISNALADPAVLASLALHFCILWIAFRSIRKGRPVIGFGLILFYISYLPWLLVAQNEQLVEYKSYLGVAGLAISLAGLLARIRSTVGELSAAVVVLLIGAGLATATVHRNEVFKNPIAIWNDVIRKYPGHFRAHVSLGMSLAERHEYPEAIREYRAANEIDRYNAALHYYTGNALRDMGKVRDAIDEFREARRIAGGDLHIALNLGNAWASLGEMDKAIEVYRAGLAQAEPSTDKTIIAQAHFNLANTLGRETKNAEAEREYRAAIEANPTYAKAYYGLGLILEQLGRREEALEDLYTALRLNPNYYEAEAAVKDILRKKSIGE